MLLDATMAGLATCTLTHITEVPASREIVADVDRQSSPTIPQVLIRVGLSAAIEDVLRRRRGDRSMRCSRFANGP